MTQHIRVSILDDHMGIINGYRYQLDPIDDIEIVSVATYADELQTILTQHNTDVLILDIYVPNNESEDAPYPIFHEIPKLHQMYPDLAILVVSAFSEYSLIKAVTDTGINGYILKDDLDSIQNIDSVIRTIYSGQTVFSSIVQENLKNTATQLTPRQREILSLLAADPNRTLADVALRLKIASSTVRNTLGDSYRRLGVTNRLAAVNKAREMGIITPYFPSIISTSATNKSSI